MVWLAGCAGRPQAPAPVEQRLIEPRAAVGAPGGVTASIPHPQPAAVTPAPQPRPLPPPTAVPPPQPRPDTPAADTVTEPRAQSPAPPPDRAADAYGQPAQLAPETGAAVVALVQRAEHAEPDRAAVLLERALRIEPGNAALWQRLALVRVAQQRFGQAEQIALKSNAYAAYRPDLWRGNWAIVADARRQLGDERGAAYADRKYRDGVR